jgi:hypothetical protein
LGRNGGRNKYGGRDKARRRGRQQRGRESRGRPIPACKKVLSRGTNAIMLAAKPRLRGPATKKKRAASKAPTWQSPRGQEHHRVTKSPIRAESAMQMPHRTNKGSDPTSGAGEAMDNPGGQRAEKAVTSCTGPQTTARPRSPTSYPHALTARARRGGAAPESDAKRHWRQPGPGWHQLFEAPRRYARAPAKR